MDDIVPGALSTTEPAGRYRLRVTGDLDIATGPDVRAALLRAVSGHSVVLVDLSALTFCDCAGLGALLAGSRAATLQGSQVRLVAVPDFMLRLLRVSQTFGAFAYGSF